jgi:hypothetical protein
MGEEMQALGAVAGRCPATFGGRLAATPRKITIASTPISYGELVVRRTGTGQLHGEGEDQEGNSGGGKPSGLLLKNTQTSQGCAISNRLRTCAGLPGAAKKSGVAPAGQHNVNWEKHRDGI